MRQDNSHQIRSYTRRSGRITEAQQRAINLYSHRYTLSSDNFDWKASFCREAPRYVEIGFGMGDMFKGKQNILVEINNEKIIAISKERFDTNNEYEFKIELPMNISDSLVIAASINEATEIANWNIGRLFR